MVRLTEDNGDLRMEDRGQRPEGGGRRTEDGGRRREDGGQMPEAGGRRTEDGGRRAEGGDRKSAVGDRWSDIRIPKEATVFGRHGGDDSFDIPWVQEAVVEIAKENQNIWFLFLNTRVFRGAAGISNIVFLPATADPVLKRRFLNTCDAMLHGRQRGETFGLSCLEVAILGKPVLTYADSPERAHLEILGEAAVAYKNAQHLRGLLLDRGRWSEIGSRRTEDGGRKSVVGSRWSVAGGRKSVNGLFSSYEPEAVIKKFQEVFLT